MVQRASSHSRVRSYFDEVAGGYQTASKGAVWGILRRREERALMRMAGQVAGRDVLELGCGAGYYTRVLLAAGARHVWAVDLSERMLAQLPQQGVTPLLADATAVEPGRKFDLLLSAGMLEFVPDPVAALHNAARLANSGARLAILYPTASLLGRAYRRFHRGHGLAIRLFDRAGLHKLAASTGWTVEESVAAGPYSACSRLTRTG
jgi:ubiquinone/menaquinone biosynthesis C-methylase UbiE